MVTAPAGPDTFTQKHVRRRLAWNRIPSNFFPVEINSVSRLSFPLVWCMYVAVFCTLNGSTLQERRCRGSIPSLFASQTSSNTLPSTPLKESNHNIIISIHTLKSNIIVYEYNIISKDRATHRILSLQTTATKMTFPEDAKDSSLSKDSDSKGEAPEDTETSMDESTTDKASTPRSKEAGTKRKAGELGLPDEDDEGSCKRVATESAPATPSPTSIIAASTPATIGATPGTEPRSASRIKSCLVEGCEKLRAKSGYCLRHFKNKSAPIRSGTPEYERRICVIEGCERLRSKGEHCHRHHKDPNAPIRNKSDKPTDRKRKCSIDNCDRLQVKAGFCSRHFRDKTAPVLTTPAFSFDADARWDELFPQLQAFHKKNGHSRVPTSQKTDLARFVVHIRCVYRTKKQKMAKVDHSAAAVAETGSEAGSNDNGIPVEDAIVESIDGVAEDTTDADSSHPDLTKSKLLTPERMAALETVNFEFQLWTVEPSQWEQRFQELLAYKNEHGHFHVTNKQNATLSRYVCFVSPSFLTIHCVLLFVLTLLHFILCLRSLLIFSWCKTQRQRYKNTMAIYQGLYGVELTCPQKKAKELYEKAQDKAREAKEAIIASGEADGNVVKQAAVSTPNLTDIGEAKNMMDPERICKLNAVGFEWELQKDTYVESWENRYNQLLKFKVVNGHCRVPKSSGDNPQLGQWVKQMRKYYGWKEDGKPYPSTFTEERIARLNELDFEWRLKDATPMKSGLKVEDSANTPVIAARILNNQLNTAVDVAPLQQYQSQGPGAPIPLNAGTNVGNPGNHGENPQSMNWAWGNNGYDGPGNSATV